MSATSPRSNSPQLKTFILIALAVVIGVSSLAEARVTKIEVVSVESPTFEGTSFGPVGAYEKLRWRVFGEVDPNDPHNLVIADLRLAPRNARGMVEYSMEVLVLKPISLTNGNHRLVYHMNNRGNIGILGAFNDGGGGNNPTKAADAGNGFLMRHGYTVISSGWDPSVRPGNNRLTISVPVATNSDGSPVVGPSLEEFVVDDAMTMTGALTYPAVTLDKSQASLSVRVHYTDPPVVVPSTGWEYVDTQTIRLLPSGSPFQQGRLYEFKYPAKDPTVAGLGFVATRDLATFLRHAAADDNGQANPLAGNVQAIYTFGISQPARYMRDFVHLGFNEDERGRPVFDGILNWIGGGSGVFLNYRFAQPARTHRQHIGRWYPEREFPFANQVMFDPVTNKTDGRLRRCLTNNTCPKIFEVNSANEYWVKAGSLLHTDTIGKDLADPPNVRYYLMSSLPHSAGSGRGICAQPRNPLAVNPVLRALLVALDDWVISKTEPPASQVPRRANGTLIPSMPRHLMGFPDIPGVTYTGLMTTGDLFDFGPSFDQGILTLPAPRSLGSPYPAFVPKTDADGNDIAGIRLPEVTVPLATYTGWALRQSALGGDDLCDAAGQKIDFLQTKAKRLEVGDPRRSLEERYPNHRDYMSAVVRAATDLRKQRLLLEEDVERYTARAVENNPAK